MLDFYPGVQNYFNLQQAIMLPWMIFRTFLCIFFISSSPSTAQLSDLGQKQNRTHPTMADRGRSSSPPEKKPLKFRRHSHSHSHQHHHHYHGHTHYHHPHEEHDVPQELPGPSARSEPDSGVPPRPHPHHHLPAQGHSTDISLRIESPRGSGNELYIVDVFDGAVSGKEGHTSVAIYSASSNNVNVANPALMFPPLPQHPDPPPRASKPSKPKSAEYDRVSQTGDPYKPDKNDVYRTVKTHPTRFDVDTQEVANDTGDLDRIMFTTPFLLNFRHYDELEVALHVGLRKKNKLPFSNPTTFVPPTTDDYNREIFRYLKTQPSLKALKLILEVHSDDDILTYKTFDDDKNVKPGGKGKGPRPAKITGSDFPIILSNTGTFWKNRIPLGLNLFHVELPGLSSCYLNDWKRFMELQTGLHTLICNFGAVLWTFYQNTVKKNEKTLEKVVLRRVISYDVKNQKHLPLDFAMFVKCSKLGYLKVTGGGYKEGWGGDWVNFGVSQSRIQQNEIPQQEMLFHINFDTIPIDNLVEFHFSRMTISRKLLEEMAIVGQAKKLQVICADCPDREYYDEDWQISADQSKGSNVEIDIMFGGYSARHAEHYKNQQQRKNCLIIFLLILTIIACLAMTVAISVAISYSNGS